MRVDGQLAGWILLHLLVGLAGTWLARRYALHRRMIDQPGERRSHLVATPRGGGISIVFALLLALGLLALWNPQRSMLIAAAAAGLLLVAGAGWVDDHRPLPVGLRLAAHCIASAILALAVQRESAELLPAALVFGGGLVLVNVWNFMDGIDGLAATQAAIVGLGYALVASDQDAGMFALALVAAACGFLPFNFPRARLFLGDVGSGSLGFALVVILALAVSAENAPVPTLAGLALLLPLSAFLVDASLTLGRRILRGERWWTAHVEHGYQRWVARGPGHAVVTIAYAGWTAAGVGVMLCVRAADPAFIMAAFIAWHLLAVLCWIRLQGLGRVPSEGRRA